MHGRHRAALVGARLPGGTGLRTRRLALLGLALAFLTDPAPASDCAAERDTFDPERIVGRLFDADGDVIRQAFGLYEERCDGGLYLVDLATEERLVRINDSWWLESFESAGWLDADHDEIGVTARYITGIGPTGAQPFRARVLLTRDGSRWTASEPELLEPAVHPPTSSDDAITLRALRDVG